MEGRLRERENGPEGFESSRIGVVTQHLGFKDFRVVYIYEEGAGLSKYLNGDDLDITDFGGISAKDLSERFKTQLGIKSSLSETLSYGLFRHRYNTTPENEEMIKKTIERIRGE